MIYWWLLNSWVGIMALAEFSKQDGVFGNPSAFWWVWMGVATTFSVYSLIIELKKLKGDSNEQRY